MSELWDEAPDDLPAGQLGPVFTAGLETECESCDEPIVPGEDARADGAGGWIHADDMCEKVARSSSDISARRPASWRDAPCRQCFIIHAGECS